MMLAKPRDSGLGKNNVKFFSFIKFSLDKLPLWNRPETRNIFEPDILYDCSALHVSPRLRSIFVQNEWSAQKIDIDNF